MSLMPVQDKRVPTAPSGMGSPAGTFVWSRGGQRLTPAEIARRRQLTAAQGQRAGDTSPIGHWSQGLVRVLDGLSVGLENRRLAKAEEANRVENDEIATLLMPKDGAPVADDVVLRALMNPNVSEGNRGVAKMMFEQRAKGPVEPVIKQLNNGDYVGFHPITGEIMFTQKDPNPRPVFDWITTENRDGTKTLVPMGPNGPAGGGMPPQPLPERPVGNLTPITGGGASNGAGGFPR